MVQPTGVNALIALVSSQALPASTEDAGDDSDFAQQFSQLLNDSGRQFDGQSNAQLQGKFAKPSSLAALSAQEVPNAKLDALTQLLGGGDQVINAQDAQGLVVRVEKILSQDRSPATVQALTQIKEQLQGMVRSGQPRSVAAILEASPAVKESKLSVLGLTALLSPRKNEIPADQTAPEEEESSAAALLAVPTAIFRPDATDGGAAQAETTDAQAKKQDPLNTVSVMTPLAAVMVSPALAVALNDNGFRSQSQLDEAIPPLVSSNASAEPLPELNLPAWTADTKTSKPPVSGFFESLAAASATAQTAKKLSSDDMLVGNAAGDALSGVSTTAALAGNQTTSAAQPVNVVATHGYVNHAPVTEQVHVAVRNATKDGLEQITVQLDPLELGRVEVVIQTNRDGLTQISFMVDKPETFDSLSRDARSLERALQESGVKTDTGSMQFNLRQQPQPQQHSDSSGGGRHAKDDQADGAQIASIAPIDTSARNYLFNVREGVDISA